ncbi:MupA/Atu3671 family FMN-dependent luciferase-like monooxygenase [Roseivivax sediminis]|uniref:Natural product biosynthesis luciferase-like monooxygenase domain-containing protein n=1 Tax=Roseivivax sediminis TaxID=936889 RepID=A0A1I1ULV3_9RHOB|nr:MupA/Atu3671 family FMN-dependent luciferase-like monooxygenase [Roseivivax sediminis]SFD71796.1 natural product biosynthesis luciferase-like monooxygenase domain-containing protein [Roseivivax sediminis]
MTAFTALVWGHDTLTAECGRKLLERGHRIAAVVTRAEAVADWARGAGLTVLAPGEADGAPDCDWLFSIANLDIIPEAVLARPAKGAINFHDGPLPRHAGLNAPVWALIAGEARHGIAWHLIEGGVDEGDILAARAVDIGPRDTALTLNMKCFEAALASFDGLVAALERGAPERVAQDLSRRTWHGKAERPEGQGVLDPARLAAELERLARALDYGGYWNPLCVPKLRAGGEVYAAPSAEIAEGTGTPGIVLRHEGGRAVIACGEGALSVTLTTLEGGAVDLAAALPVGAQVQRPEDEADVARHDGFWREALTTMRPATIPGASEGAGETVALPLPTLGAEAVAALALQVTDGESVVLAWRDAAIATLAEGGLVAGWVPLTAERGGSLSDLAGQVAGERDRIAKRGGFARDLVLRDPALNGLRVPAIALSDAAGAVPGAALTVELRDGAALLHADTGRISRDYAQILADRLIALNAAERAAPLASLAVMPESERAFVLDTVNASGTDVAPETMHALFERQVQATPNVPALVFESQALTYAQLDARANAAAHVLREMGVGPGTVVGLCCRRSPDLVVAAYAILKAGGAYLPLDPAYPADRLSHYLTDSGAGIVVTQSDLAGTLPGTGAALLNLDTDPRLAAAPVTAPEPRATPEDLAYLIYTSGSTGTPKGVMVEHRNVANFYAGMDAHVPEPGGTWLAVTSLSFDISVLELFYTTARGYKVVLSSDSDRGMISKGPLGRGGMEFSLYYWGNDDGVGPDKYRTLLEGARFADENGFVAVWTPERHFHAFGGPYPNPSVTGAAVAGMTKNIGVRAGSCVAPLHHPARIAEEWAVIDNLTNGRAGLAIASGWQPDDFVLRPENTPPANKPAMIDTIHTLRKLWRGEPVAFPKQDGTPHEVVTQPRPVSQELPVWVTTAGNPETWKEAGRIGANILTHLLGQSVDEVREKIGLYHAALREAGHDPADFTVTLMLHTCIAETRDAAREVAREPMKDYLRSAAGLIKQYAWAFPAFKKPQGVETPMQLDLGSLSEEELEGILDFAFERYFNDSGLFGTVEDAVARTDRLREIGVTEIACLIDYGIAPDTILAGLRPLAEVVARANAGAEPAEDDFTIAAQVVRHGVTHLQCTPSMARMIAMNDEARFALRGVKHLFIGGEPLPGALVDDLATATDARVTNMYGPTETTIWSSVERATAGEGVVNIGRPIANTRLYVLDAARAPVPVGVSGELWIGGHGVTRGYWNRSELTAERFVEDPFHGGRMYRTGDLVRRRADGRIDFVGRVDNQVKIRGHRIELGEIEAALEAQPGVRQAVVAAREDRPGDVRLVGYYTGSETGEAALKAALAARLPEIMVPGRIVRLEAFPLTPNKKVDRGALPAPSAAAPAQAAPAPVPRAKARPAGGGAVQTPIAAIWSRILGVAAPGGRDNFFDLGGHSLLAVQAHRAIREELSVPDLSITDIFRFPVLGQLAERVAELSGSPAEPQTSGPANARAQSRSDAMARRAAMRARRKAG